MATTLTTDWKHKASTLAGLKGTHSALAKRIKGMGFAVEADDDDEELTFIAIPGEAKFAHRLVGEIRGGQKAAVTITVKLN